MVCVRFTKMWPTTKIQVSDISEILKSVCVGPSPKKVGGSSNAIKRVGIIKRVAYLWDSWALNWERLPGCRKNC